MAESFGPDPKFSGRTHPRKSLMKSARYKSGMLVVLVSRIVGSYRSNGNCQESPSFETTVCQYFDSLSELSP